MQKLIIFLFSLSLLFSSCTQERFHIDDIIIKEKIAYTKLDMKQVSGIVFCEFGDIGKFSKGKKVGEHKKWHQNGELSFKGNFSNNKKHGVCRWYYENGKLRYEGAYASDVGSYSDDVTDKFWGNHILWDENGDDCNHDEYELESKSKNDTYVLRSQGYSSSSSLYKCKVCDKISKKIYVRKFDKNYFLSSDTFSIYIPEKKIMGLTLMHIDSVFNIEESKELPIYDTLIYTKNSQDEIKIDLNSSGICMVYCKDFKGELVYKPIEASLWSWRQVILNPSRETYAIDTIVYLIGKNNIEITRTCVNQENGENRPSYWDRRGSRYSSNLVIDISNVDFILSDPPETVRVRVRKNADGTGTVIDR